ncbi:MAG: hypothetical protein OXC05_16480 [Halieaceae bacterium]|nr:hypothetical protein [Halieaceae bacterium]
MSIYKPRLPFCLTMVFSFLAANTSTAQSIEDAYAAYTEGRFVEATEIAETLQTSEGHALAANSLAIYSYYVADDGSKQGLFTRAALLAQEAIRLDASNPQAHLQWAHSTGRYAQTIGVLKAANQGYAKKVRDSIKTALELDPEMASAHLSLATWHAEAISAGGFMAGVLYGASRKKALAQFEKALELAPEQKVVLVEYGLGLLRLGGGANRKRAHDLLLRSSQIPSLDAHDRILHQLAVRQLEVLDGQNPPK